MSAWLNYHHLYYFWIIAQEQSISSAARRLRVTQPTLSAQLKQLEDYFGQALCSRRGKTLQLTEEGTRVFDYAGKIFALGDELQHVMKKGSHPYEHRLRIGIVDSVPKLVSYKVLSAIHSDEKLVKLECFENKREALLAMLGSHQLDVVLSDAAFSDEVAVKAFNHHLGASDIALYGNVNNVEPDKFENIHDLEELPFLLPTKNAMMRRAVDAFFDLNSFRPNVVAEFEDSALMKTFGAEGRGVFPMITAIEAELEATYKVKPLLTLSEVQEHFYLLSLERKVTHPAIAVLTQESGSIFGSK